MERGETRTRLGQWLSSTRLQRRCVVVDSGLSSGKESPTTFLEVIFLVIFIVLPYSFPGRRQPYCPSLLSWIRLFLGKKTKICHQCEGATQAPHAAGTGGCCLSWVLLAVR